MLLSIRACEGGRLWMFGCFGVVILGVFQLTFVVILGFKSFAFIVFMDIGVIVESKVNIDVVGVSML